MTNERKTEALVRTHFANFADEVMVEEQVSDSLQIQKLLARASKRGEGQGFPDFLITFKSEPHLLIVAECKANRSSHQSNSLDQAADYAVDGALHYASFLSTHFDVIAIGISGETSADALVSHFLHLRGAKQG